MIPQNIKREHLLKAILEIEKFENGCANQRQLASRYGRLKTIA